MQRQIEMNKKAGRQYFREAEMYIERVSEKNRDSGGFEESVG